MDIREAHRGIPIHGCPIEGKERVLVTDILHSRHWNLNLLFHFGLGVESSRHCKRHSKEGEPNHANSSQYVASAYRREYFSNMLRNPISFFDKEANASGALMSRLSTDPKQLFELMGLNGVFPLISMFNMMGCIAIAFSFGWKLTLVTFFSALPVIFISAFVRLRFEIEFEQWNARVFAHSSQFATEAIGAFRTVTSLTMEESIIDKYSALLQDQIRKATKKASYASLVFALTDSVELCAIALTYW